MKIALINVSSTLTSDGCRLISALLKRAGHSVKSIFLARSEPSKYEWEELEQMDKILKTSDLVMIGVYSSYAARAVQVTEFVHSRYSGMKVIWGGPHCISAPELGLRYADGICFSEGDQVVVDLINAMEAGTSYLETANMAFNVNGSPIVNNVLPPFSDLDSLPYYDYELKDQFLLDRGLFPITKDKFNEHCAGYPYYIPTFYFTTSRGCPHNCSYCNNCRYITLFGYNPVRFHSVDRVIEELGYTLRHLDFFKFVGFGDDDFFGRPIEQLKDFARKYKKRIGLPFGVAVSANTYRRDKMEILLDAGLKLIQMGVQSGSQRILDQVYNRNIKTSKAMEVVHQIVRYQKSHSLDFLLDFIIDNPYEHRDDIIQTYQFLLDVPPHVKINTFFLSFFPGTPIYERALEDGIIGAFDEKAFRFYRKSHVKYQKNYETVLILLIKYLRHQSRLLRYIPRSVFRALGSRTMRGIASIFPRSFYSFLSRVLQ